MKSIKDLTFTDDFMFGEIMKNEEICKGVIERLLHIKKAQVKETENKESSEEGGSEE